MSLFLSKSKYCNAVQCPKILWMKKNMPEKFDDSDMPEAIFETGNQVAHLAKGLFGDYCEVSFGDINTMLAETKHLIDIGVKIIAEASFSYKGLFCSVDILIRCSDGTIEIYENKSSTGVKDIYLHDVAFQYYVLTKLGYDIRKVSVVHINNEYVRYGDLEIDKLFSAVDITSNAMLKFNTVAKNIEYIETYLNQTSEPSLDLHEGCFSPYSCGFRNYCGRHLPSPSVFDVSRLRLDTKFSLYRQGYTSYAELINNSLLSRSQIQQISASYYNKPPYIDGPKIKEYLTQLFYPLYFLDFESYQSAVPQWDGMRPYEQIPFQYSLHWLDTKNGILHHTEFLAETGTDPRRPLAERLVKDIPVNVCITAYNMAFEKSVIRRLAEVFFDLAPHLMCIHDNIRDLMLPFQKRYYYVAAMRGSYSIKYVLPALFPDDPALDYHNLKDIHNGSEAMSAFSSLSGKPHTEAKQIRINLLNYCKLDTYAMVKIWQKLYEVNNL